MLICCDGLFLDVGERPVASPCCLPQEEKGGGRYIEYECV